MATTAGAALFVSCAAQYPTAANMSKNKIPNRFIDFLLALCVRGGLYLC
jgi:hypothetical protein